MALVLQLQGGSDVEELLPVVLHPGRTASYQKMEPLGENRTFPRTVLNWRTGCITQSDNGKNYCSLSGNTDAGAALPPTEPKEDFSILYNIDNLGFEKVRKVELGQLDFFMFPKLNFSNSR